MCEAIFADIASVQPLHVLSLRYFTLIGADLKMRTGLQLRQPTHALGSMILAHDQGAPFLITGTDYPTRDGSGLRDYIQIWDLAAAHLAALGRAARLGTAVRPARWHLPLAAVGRGPRRGVMPR